MSVVNEIMSQTRHTVNGEINDERMKGGTK